MRYSVYYGYTYTRIEQWTADWILNQIIYVSSSEYRNKGLIKFNGGIQTVVHYS